MFTTPSRASFSEYRTNTPSMESEIESSNQNNNNPIKFKAPIAEPEPGNFQTSPTHSDFNTINVISKKFEINKEYLRQEFYSPLNKEKREWYFKTFSQRQVLKFREIWYTEMKLKEMDIPFFTWFEFYSSLHNYDYLFKTINVSSSTKQNWEQTDGSTTRSTHPPLKDIKINANNRQILATPFKTGANRDDKEPIFMQDIKPIYHQNNYQCQILHTIAKQIDNIDDKISNEENILQHPFSSITKPIFKPLDREVKFPDNNILKTISSRLNDLDKGKGIHTINENDNESIQTSETEEVEQEINRIKNRNIRSRKPYYKKHTPPDLLFEEHHKYSGNIYTGEGIYEWNIDGRSEYEIMNLLQEMGMAAIAYKARGNTDKQACVLMITGFTGALKYWWDNALDRIAQDYIINHIEEIKIERDDGLYDLEEKQNAVEVLIHTLTMHFIGNPAEELENKKLILTTLRCPTLEDFKWYKDVFVTNIFQRNDCNQSFWKERFISGLPTFFAERIINKLKEYSGGNPIPWNSITYGQLFAFIKKEGLTICKEQKDKKRNDNFKFKTTMGEFCRQYGYEKLYPPSRVKRIKNKHQIRNNDNKHYYHKNKRYTKNKNQFYTKNKKYNKNFPKKQKLICWNCKRPGHRSTECKMKRKIHEIFQDQPDIQEKLTKLLISESEKTSENESSYSINEIDNSSDSSESQEFSDNLCPCKTINVITNDKQFLLDIIDKIDDPEIKKQYLIKLKDLITQENRFSTPEPFSLNKIYEKYPTQSLFKQVTTGELQNEIKQLKSQVKQLQLTVNQQQLAQLEIEAKLSLIESNIKSRPSTSTSDREENIETTPLDENNYIQIINEINYQKWYTKITLHVGYDYKINIIALMDTGADHNCIREGIIPTKYYEKTSAKLSGANGSTLKVQYKLPSAKICNNGYCFKNQFILVKNLTQEVILGTPFFTQIYPFTVNETGVSTKIMGTPLLFKFLSPMKAKEVLTLQQNTIQKTINLIKGKQNHIQTLQEEITYKKI